MVAAMLLAAGMLAKVCSGAVPRADIVGLVRSSPEIAGKHDKEGWIGLYASDASVEDPVGTGAQVGPKAIGHFYDAFIARNDVNFSRVFQPDVVSNASACELSDCHAYVGRSVEITTTLSTGLVVKVDPVLIYEVVGTAEGLRIGALRTYWPLLAEFGQVTSQGALGVETLAVMSASLLENLGVGGSMYYAKGILGVGEKGEKMTNDLVDAVKANDTLAFSALLSKAEVEVPIGHPSSAAEAWRLLAGPGGLSVDRLHAASDFVGLAVTLPSGAAAVLRVAFHRPLLGALRITKLEVVMDDTVFDALV